VTRFRHLALTRPLAAIDLESTGTDPATDRAVEIAVLTVAPDRPADLFATRVNPGRPVPAAATAVHGLADADVRDAPTFAALAPGLARRLAGCDLAGFGIARFDLPLLTAEFGRAGVPFSLAGRAVLDALTVYHRHEARTLAAAVGFYLGRGHAGAHAAGADAAAAAEVLDAQVGRYGLPAAPADLHAALVGVDVAGRFRRGPGGAVEFAFGKHAGRPLAEVARADPGYLRWVLTQAFLPDVHDLVRAAVAAAAVGSK
jgi:DNA polymerase-3 subunit epsilon